MNHLEDDLRHALQARDGPPPGAQARNLAALRVSLAVGPLGPLGDGGAGLGAGADVSAPVTSLWAAKVAGATLGLAAAGLVALKLGAAALGGGGPSSTQTPAAAPAIIAEASAEGPVDGAPALEPEVPAAASEEAPALAEDDATGQPAAKLKTPAERRDAEPAPSADASNSLDAELALISAAKKQRDTSPKAALAKLGDHAASFPAGVLAPERDALEIELLCGLARADEAQAAAARFGPTHGRSPLRARFEAACKAEGVELEP